MVRRGRHRTFALLGFFMLAIPAKAFCADYEMPPVISAQEIIGDRPVSGDHYQIAPDVSTDGFMARIKIVTPYGDFSASGPGMLDTRLNEIRALAALQEIEDDEIFQDAVEDTARDTAGNLKAFAENPVETLKGVPSGVGRFFDRTERSVRTGVQKLGDIRQGNAPGVNPNSHSNLPGETSATDGVPEMSFVERLARAGGDVTVDILGYDKQRRRLAKELGVDPYTSNAALSEKLDEVTWAAFAGGLGVNILTRMVPGGLVISTSTRMSDWVWDTAPGDLRVEIEAQLASLGLPQDDIERFLRHVHYSLSMQAAMTGALADLEGVDGRADIFDLVLNVGSEGQARFLVQTVDMFRNYHLRREPLSRLDVDGTIIGIRDDAGPIVMAPVDLASWTAPMDNFSARVGNNSDATTIILTGRLTDMAREKLVARGWQVEETTDLWPGAYPLQ